MSYLGRSAKLSLKAQEKVSFLATAGQTAKTGLSYVPNFVEVYVNGILLTDTTDFTATNGNSVTFTVALALNDEVTVVSLKTFTVADTYSKADANTLLAAKETVANVALKAPLASPSFTGTVAIGHTTTSGSNFAICDGANSQMQFFAEIATDTNLVQNYDPTASVYINSEHRAASHAFKIGTSEKVKVTSGGLTFNGDTAAANALDDYEEGTWTPTFGGGMTITYGSRTASYTKVGQSVTWNCSIQWGSKSGGSGTLTVSLPFAVNATGQWQGGAGCSYAGGITQTIRGSGYSESNAASCYISSAANNTGNIQVSHMGTSGHLIMGGSYQTSS
mgnify:CR=1 FL=1